MAMSAPCTAPGSPTPSPETIRRELDRISASPLFAQSATLLRFLRYLVESALDGRAGELKEYTIGLEAFGRDEGFDPREDAVVRVQAHRLRRHLEKHYESNGHGGEVRIELPRGGYRPVFVALERPGSSRGDGFFHAVSPLGLGGAAAVALLVALAAIAMFATGTTGDGQDFEAHRLLSEGRRLQSEGKAEGLRRSIVLFEKAAQRDPGNALPHEALAEALVSAGFHGLGPLPPGEMVRRARSAATSALQTGDGGAGALCALGVAAWLNDRDFAAADRHFIEAIRADPRYFPARHWRALSLSAQGRAAEAAEECRRAARVPGHEAGAELALALYYGGQLEEAAAEARRVLEERPALAAARTVLGMCAAALGQPRRAAAELEDALRQAGGGAAMPEIRGRLGNAYAAAGDGVAALEILVEIGNRPEAERPYAQMAMVYVGVGDTDRAIECLERSAERHEGAAAFAAVDPVFRSLHPDIRFQALLRRMGLGQTPLEGSTETRSR